MLSNTQHELDMSPCGVRTTPPQREEFSGTAISCPRRGTVVSREQNPAHFGPQFSRPLWWL